MSQSLAGRPSSRSRTQPPTTCAEWPAAWSRRHTSSAGGAISSMSGPLRRRAAQPAEDLVGAHAQRHGLAGLTRAFAEAGERTVAARQLEIVRDLGEDPDRALEQLARARGPLLGRAAIGQARGQVARG